MLRLIYSYNYKSFVAFSAPKSSKTYEKETFPIRFVPEYLTRIFVSPIKSFLASNSSGTPKEGPMDRKNS